MKLDYDCESYVDVKITNKTTGSFRVQPTACHITPKRIYTIGGAVFDRATGRQIIKLEHRAWSDYVWRADPASIRATKERAEA